MTTILYVEDNEDNVYLLEQRLRRKGYKVLVARDGQEGVDMARRELPDLVIMDLELPVLDGWEATRQLKADSATAAIPVVALTAHALAGQAEKALAAGCDDFDTKPVRFRTLHDKIHALLANGCSSRLPAATDEMPVEVTRFFQSISLFADMEDTELEDVARMVRPFGRASGEPLFRQGEASDGMYVIGRGKVEIRARVPGDAAMTLAELGAGELLGEISLLDSGARTATAVALTPTTGYWFGRQHFEFLRRDMKPASLTLMRRLIANASASLQRSYERIGELAGLTAPAPRDVTSALEPANASHVPFDALPFFSRLSVEERRGVVQAGRVFSAERGQELYRQGAPAKEVFVVLRGAARTTLGQPDRSFTVAVHAPGAVVGLLGGLLGDVHGTTGFAAESSLVLRIPRSALRSLQAETAPRAFHLGEHLHENLVFLLRRCTDHASRLELERHLRAAREGEPHV